MEENKNDGKKAKTAVLLIVFAVLGVALLIGGSISEKRSTSVEELKSGSDIPDPESYAEYVEERVKELCSKIDGVGSVSAVVTLRGGYRRVYAMNSQSLSSGYKTELVLIGNGSSEQAVEICYENPEIAGIGIVCVGGGNSSVRQAIIEVVSAAFDVSTNKISVVEAKMK